MIMNIQIYDATTYMRISDDFYNSVNINFHHLTDLIF